jgi:predicted secreted protein
MGWISAAVVFVVLWWLVFFTILPLGVQRQERPGEGHDPGAPMKAGVLWKMGLTTLVAGVLLGVVWVVMEFHLISLGDM